MITKFCLLGVLDRFILIHAVLVIFFAHIGLTPALIGMILSGYEIGKIFGDSMCGTIADKYGRKNVIIFGFIIKAISILSFVFVPGMISCFIGTMMIGFGRSGTSNIESYMYDEFKSNKIDEHFKSALALKSIMSNVGASLGGYAASFLYKLNGFNGIFITSSLVMLFISIPYVIFFLKDHKEYTLKNTDHNLIKIIHKGLSYLKQNLYIGLSIVIVSIFYSTYIIYTDTNKMIMNDIGLSPDFIAKIYAIAHIFPIITTSVFLIFRPGLLIRAIIILSSIIWLGIGLTAFLFYGNATVAAILFFLLLFPIFDTCIRDNMHRLIKDSSIRSTIVSFSHLISSMINIFASLCIGFIAEKSSYANSLIFFSIFIIIFTFVILFLQRFTLNKKRIKYRSIT